MNEERVELGEPGAGLPWLELQIARVGFAWSRWRKSRAEFADLFVAERDRVLELAARCDAETGTRQVLIDRVRGMEDSSRHWSVFMTLEHLRMVNLSFAGILRSLVRDEIPEGEARTADVKPGPGVGIEVLPEFERSCELFLKNSHKIAGGKGNSRFSHPWFGPMDADGWHALGAVHMRIHRQQIEKILEAQ